MRKIKNTVLVCLAVAVFALALTVGLVATPQTIANADTDKQYIDTEVVLFGDVSNAVHNALYFSLSNSDYGQTAGNSSANVSGLNLESMISYVDKDGKPHTMAEYGGQRLINLFERWGAFAFWETGITDYTEFQSVTVKAGCEFPSLTDPEHVVYKTTETVTFENNGDGTFTGYRDTEVTSFGDYGAGDTKNALFFRLSNSDYGDVSENPPANVSGLNLESMISCVDKDGKTHAMAEYGGQRLINLFGRWGTFAFWETGITDYTEFQSVTIKEGCEFPSYRTKDQTSQRIVYRTTKTVTFKNNGTAVWYPEQPEEPIGTSIASVSLFLNTNSATPNNDYFLNIVLGENDYEGQNTLAARDARNRLNMTNYILIDDQPASIVEASEAFINIWGSANAFGTRLPNSDASKINKITIKEGCKFPSVAMVTDNVNKYYVTTEDVTFIRSGDVFMRENTYQETSVTLFGDPGDLVEGTKPILWFTLSSNDYSGATSNLMVNGEQLSALNLKSKIKFKFQNDEKGYTLSEYMAANGLTGTGFLNLYVRANVFALRFGEDASVFDYTQLEWITIEENCDFPSWATSNEGAGGGYTLYRTTETVTFSNIGKGLFATLQEARNVAKEELANYKDMSEYRAAEQASIQEILDESYKEIDGCDSWTKMTAAVKATKAKLDQIKTDAELTYEEEQEILRELKANAKTELSSYKDKSAYRAEEQEQISVLLEAAEAEIDACDSRAAINAVVAEYKEKLDELKTDADYKVEALLPAKADALDKIGKLKAALDITAYSDENLAKISELYKTATHDIENAASEEEIDEIIATFKANIDAVPVGRDDPDLTPGGDTSSEGKGCSCTGSIGGLRSSFAILFLVAGALLLNFK